MRRRGGAARGSTLVGSPYGEFLSITGYWADANKTTRNVPEETWHADVIYFLPTLFLTCRPVQEEPVRTIPVADIRGRPRIYLARQGGLTRAIPKNR